MTPEITLSVNQPRVDLSSEPANGVWTLEVPDRYGETAGRLVSWTLEA
ncbi:proprotein convertase P-domain-containing protein [Actinoplanes auranticolor]|uniref:P/Homo B domain-containing protein n=1 Tax=Actinoplanes auranticolor TaxID=47988 RepID=A0A919VVJ9_9ACTN|nr:proprotein convertase P-domain-containing protein [Actinoplanes auranticolor]GIM80664.1 hypothetical protein Aau02nite_91610 [Actinoplanes auranticolor]